MSNFLFHVICGTWFSVNKKVRFERLLESALSIKYQGLTLVVTATQVFYNFLAPSTTKTTFNNIILTCSLIFLHWRHWKPVICCSRFFTRFVPSTKSISLIFKSLIGSMSGCRLLVSAVTPVGCQSYARFNNSWVAKMVDCDGGSSLLWNETRQVK